MCHRYLFEVLNRILKDIMNNDLIFGGDFHQILPVNEEVDNLNNHIIQKFPGETYTLRSIDSVAEDQQPAPYPPEFLNSLNISGMPPHIIKLKMGVPIMLLRNLYQRNGHCNGACYRVLSVSGNMITASKISSVDAGCILLIPCIILQSSDTDLPFTLKRRQFPVRSAFTMFINKSQAQSLSKCGIYMPASVFSHGLLYIVLSRVGDPVNLKIFAGQKEFTRSGASTRHNENIRKLTRNVVYTEIV
uniref:DNA helicase Pif1-like 2B domain-containing protein n=1 Tax=Octopus bimaculoides TaxID=37653 RepID=A0A0L8H9M0_OCTBM